MRNSGNKTLIEQASDYVEAAVEKAGPILADAKDKAEAALADAREQAGPTLVDARDKATPLIAQSAALAAEKASQVADIAAEKAAQGKEATAAKAAELSGEPKKKHRLRKLLIITGIAAALGFVAKKLRDGADKENWQSSYTPTPPPASVAGDDEGGAGPGEALADAAEESHEVTTPDEPADVVALEPGDKPTAKKSSKP